MLIKTQNEFITQQVTSENILDFTEKNPFGDGMLNMLGQQFYHEFMRKVVVAFGTLFNNINIVRKDNAGKVIQSMKVPLAYTTTKVF